MTQFHFPRNSVLRTAVIAAGLLVLPGCSLNKTMETVDSVTDPYRRPGVWRPNGANEANFELQVARAADLVQGRGAPDVDGDTAAAPVERLRKDKIRPLPQNGISGVGGNATSSGSTNGGS